MTCALGLAKCLKPEADTGGGGGGPGCPDTPLPADHE